VFWNEIIPSMNRSFVFKAKEGRHVRIKYITIDRENICYKFDAFCFVLFCEAL
jgi:hypothetical protein